MFSISLTTLIIALKKLFPKIKCIYKIIEKEDKSYCVELYFINLRSQTVIISEIKVNGSPVPISDCVVFSSQHSSNQLDVEQTSPFQSVEVVDIEGRTYKAKRSNYKK